jgi:hypothetical protein
VTVILLEYNVKIFRTLELGEVLGMILKAWSMDINKLDLIEIYKIYSAEDLIKWIKKRAVN